MSIASYPENPAKPPVTLNLCELSPWVIGSLEFNDDPCPLRLAGVREGNRGFFAKLRDASSAERRSEIFHEYLDVVFSLHHWREYDGSACRSLRKSYLRVLQGWMLDSNGPSGAVLKAWVHSRFGIPPTYHNGVLFPDEHGEDPRFANDRMRGLSYTNAIYCQLDLLYEFCQFELSITRPTKQWFDLFRGTNDPEEHPQILPRNGLTHFLRLNNVVSFTANRERAWEFGSTIWRAHIPASKIIFFSGLLPDKIMRGEEEFLVIGGEFKLKELLY